MIPIAVVITLCVLSFAIAIGLSRLFPAFQPKSINDTINLLKTQYEVEKSQRESLEIKQRDQELRHTAEVAKLNGRIDVLMGDVGEKLSVLSAPLTAEKAAPLIAQQAVPLIVEGVRDAIAG